MSDAPKVVGFDPATGIFQIEVEEDGETKVIGILDQPNTHERRAPKAR